MSIFVLKYLNRIIRLTRLATKIGTYVKIIMGLTDITIMNCRYFEIS